MQLKQALLDTSNWEERYRLLIQAGKQQPTPDKQQLAQMQKIEGCEAALWFSATKINKSFKIQAFSEARIMNGMLVLLLQELEGKTLEQLEQFNIEKYFAQFGITSRLSDSRLNGFKQIESKLHQLKNLK